MERRRGGGVRGARAKRAGAAAAAYPERRHSPGHPPGWI